jgi:FKBP-type peptidyl-prolyl cis-trans isomerase SlyD
MTENLAAAKDRVVSFHYTLRDSEGTELESSRGGEPMAALLGHENVMAGLEAALMEHLAGDAFEVTLSPEQAFGARRDGWVQRVSKKHVPKAARLKPGMIAQLPTDSGPRAVRVVKVGSSVVDVDLNHPYAGQTVTFAVELVSVREATPEELAHGHAHGAGGHHH